MPWVTRCSAGATATSGSAAPSAISFPTTTKWAIAYGYDRYGDGIWDKTLRYGVRNAYMLTFSTSVALRKFYGTGEGILFRDAFADLNRFWDSLPKVTDSGRTLTPLPEKN